MGKPERTFLIPDCTDSGEGACPHTPPVQPTALHRRRSAPPQGATHARSPRARWLKTLHQWHWVSSALALFGTLLFAVTGITLNHAGAIEARARIDTRSAPMPPALVEMLRQRAADPAGPQPPPLPAAAIDWVARTLEVEVPDASAEWSTAEVYLALPRPGGDAWLRLDLDTAEAEYEHTDHGWIAWLNDLHKGRNTGTAWRLFIDLLAGACVLFSLTGLLILHARAAHRPTVWPVVGFGLAVPAALAFLFIH